MSRTRSNIVFGILLVLVGGYLLAAQFLPALKFWELIQIPWPAWLIAVAVGLLVIGLLTGNAEMAVPATILTGIGGILWYQDMTGDWISWGYMWALIPGFVGVGVLLAGLFSGQFRARLRRGIWLIVISLVLFTIFGLLFRSNMIATYWPVALIAIGALMLLQPLLGRSEPRQPRQE